MNVPPVVDRRTEVRRILIRYLSEQLVRPIAFPQMLTSMLIELDPHLGTSHTLTAGTPPLAPRELDVLRAAADGASYRDIGAQLGLAPSTVKTLIHRLLPRLGARNTTHAVAIALRTGLLR